MKLKNSYFYTIRENLKDEDSISGNLLVRSGMIKKTSAGIYMLMPMGYKIMQNIENIIRREMEEAGSQEVLMPALLTEDVFVESNRLENFGKDMFRLKDRYDKPYVLGPTHEELFVKAGMMKVESYKDLPFNLFQIQTKYRDEPRPRFGLIRVREFSMKDAYSFDKDLDGLDKQYNVMYNSYKKIFNEIGIDYRIVEASTGTMGGLLSEEFQAITDKGEDELLFCTKCDYATNVEIAEGIEVCPKCGSKLDIKKGIEIGNIFKLGTKYSENLGFNYLDQDNKLKPVVMGSYGIGPGRCMAALVEQSHDDNGIIWPYNIAPYKVVIVSLNQDDIANKIYDEIKLNNIDVILDDRDERAGVKFKDADLIGIPIRITVGKKAIDGIIEFKYRNETELKEIKIEDIIKEIKQ